MGAPRKEGLIHLPLNGKGGQRARIDFAQMLMNVLLPVAIFAIVAAVLSFKLRYSAWPVAWFLALCCALPGLFIWWLSGKALTDVDSVQGKWTKLLYSLCLIAWLMALVLGTTNYSTNMLPFYDLSGLNYAPSVDPSASGQSHIDVGRMLFVPGSYIDVNAAMGVRVSKTYCVAPVVNPNVTLKDREHDFWAVGIGCCSSVQPQKQWTCANLDNKVAYAGMRLMTDEARPFYRMAVQEAEATYKFTAKHPIFLTWMQDPAAEMTAWRENGMKLYLEGVFSVFVLMFFVSFSAALLFSRGALESHPCQGTGFLKYVNHPEFDDEVGWEEGSRVKNLVL